MRRLQRRRTLSVRSPTRPKSDINITPLVDVVLVLLIIFMVVTPLTDKTLRVRVPDEEEVVEGPPPPGQLVVSVAADGAMALNGEHVEEADYLEKLRSILARRAPAERIVFVTADDRAPYPRLVGAFDGARRAGAELLTFATEALGP